MITLYIATHNITGLKYFGKTTKYHTEEDLQKYYHGSGKYWKRHLSKHVDDVTMEIFYQSENYKLIYKMAIMYSRFWNIVNSNKYANLILENGYDGGDVRSGSINSEEHNMKIGDSNRGKVRTEEIKQKYRHPKSEEGRMNIEISNKHKMTKEVKSKISNTLKGHTNNTEIVRNKISEKLKGTVQKLIECPYCNKIGGNSMYRWHFDNCKQKGNT